MTVVVTKNMKDVLEARVTYTDAEGNVLAETDAAGDKIGQHPTVPTFLNYKDTIDLKVQKVSRSGGEGLEGCTYALWMKGAAGDIMIAEATSDKDGVIVFKDVHLVKGQKYYYKEVEAPSGHTVDPYRTAYFELQDDGTVKVTEPTAEDGWHSKYEKQ